MEELKIKYVDPKKLIPYANNAKIHSDKQIDMIAASINEFGFNNPILVDNENTIFAGHGRLMAAYRLGFDSVPTINLTHLTDEQRKRAYRLADNRTAEVHTGWDEEMLAIELSDLSDADFDWSATGFTDDEIEEFTNLPEELKERKENLKSVKQTRILISVPAGAELDKIDDALKEVVAKGGEVDYGGN